MQLTGEVPSEGGSVGDGGQDIHLLQSNPPVPSVGHGLSWRQGGVEGGREEGGREGGRMEGGRMEGALGVIPEGGRGSEPPWTHSPGVERFLPVILLHWKEGRMTLADVAWCLRAY